MSREIAYRQLPNIPDINVSNQHRLSQSRQDGGDTPRSESSASEEEFFDPSLNNSSTALPNPERKHLMSAILKLSLILLVNLAVILTVFYSIPALTEEERQHLKLPKTLNESKILGNILHVHINQNYYRISVAHFLVIFFVHVFSVPGASFLAILAGFLYPQYFALAMILFGSTIGCTVCYLIVENIGQIVIRKYLKEKIDSWRSEVDKQRDDLWSYFLFLRLTPFLPGWFINITSPLVKIPLKIFIIGTFFGISPQSYCFVLAGTQLNQIITVGDAFSLKSIVIWSVIAVLSIIPVIIKKCFKNKFKSETDAVTQDSINAEFQQMQRHKDKKDDGCNNGMKRLKSEPTREFNYEVV